MQKNLQILNRIQKVISISIMKNILFEYCKKIVLPGYLFVQILMVIALEVAGIRSLQYVIFAATSAFAYYWVAIGDPGFVKYLAKIPPPLVSKSQPVIPFNQLQLMKLETVVQQKSQIKELGLDSILTNNKHHYQGPIQLVSIKEEEPKLPSQNSINKQSNLNTVNSGQEQIKKPSQNNVQFNNFEEVDQKHYEEIKFSSILQSNIQSVEKNIINAIQPDTQNNNIVVMVQQSAGFAILPEKLKKLNRWCKFCKNMQALRVRHCLDCRRCVSAFDHHCPWINTCIGEKNKLPYIIFLFLQVAQFVFLSFLIGNSLYYSLYSQILAILWLMVIVLTIISVTMLSFQLYMICRNITTWQYLRWNRIEYLNIFNRQLNSLFDRGLKSNLSIFLKSNCSKQHTDWMKHISYKANDCLIENQLDTDRKILT